MEDLSSQIGPERLSRQGGRVSVALTQGVIITSPLVLNYQMSVECTIHHISCINQEDKHKRLFIRGSVSECQTQSLILEHSQTARSLLSPCFAWGS